MIVEPQKEIWTPKLWLPGQPKHGVVRMMGQGSSYLHGVAGKRRTVSGPSYYPVGADCVGYWDFGDGLESATDHSPAGNNGTITGAEFDSNPLGLTFDGTDDVVNCGHNASLGHDTGDAFTYYLWVNPTAFAADSYSCLLHDAGNANYLTFYTTGGVTTLYVFLGDGAQGKASIAPTGSWTQIGITYTYNGGSPNQVCQFYQNGVAFSTPVVAGSELAGSSNDLLIGQLSASNCVFNGVIGQVLIFHGAKGSSDVLDYFNATKARYGVA